MTGLDRLPRLTADHSVGAPISRDDLWWLIAQVYQLRSELAAAEIMAGSLAGDATQCTLSIELDDGPCRCRYSVGHPGPHSYEETARCTWYQDDPWFTRCVFDADHTGTHSYEHQRKQCIPPGTEGLRECTYEPGHHSPHSFEVGAMDIRRAAKGQRRCETREGGARRCGREYGHTGPCLLQT